MVLLCSSLYFGFRILDLHILLNRNKKSALIRLMHGTNMNLQHKVFKFCTFNTSIAISPHALPLPHTLPVYCYSSPLPSFPFFTLKLLNKVRYETSFRVKRTPDCPGNLRHYSSPLPAVPIPCPATQYATPDHAEFSMMSECLCYPILHRDRLTYTVGN